MSSWQSVLLSNDECCFGSDVSAFKGFKDKHPGGSCLFELGAHASEDAAKLLFLSYHIGADMNKIRASAKQYGFPEVASIKCSPLHKEINDIFSNIVAKYWIYGLIYKVYCVMLTISFVYLLYNHMFAHSISITNSILLGLVWISYSFAVFHIRHHSPRNFFTSIPVISIFYHVLDSLMCDVVPRWTDAHHLSHHVYTNTLVDNDVLTLYPFIYVGINYNFKYRFFHKFQAFYTTLLLALAQEKRIWNHIRLKSGNPIYVVVYFLIFLIIPCLYNQEATIVQNVLNYLLFKVIVSLAGSYLLLVSHNNDLNRHKPKIVTNDYDLWVKQQIEESLSWSNDPSNILNYLVTIYVGGINMQVEHHIAPAVLPIYYLFAQKDIKQLCKNHNFKYNESNNFFSAIYAFHLYLWNCTHYKK